MTTSGTTGRYGSTSSPRGRSSPPGPGNVTSGLGGAAFHGLTTEYMGVLFELTAHMFRDEHA